MDIPYVANRKAYIHGEYRTYSDSVQSVQFRAEANFRGKVPRCLWVWGDLPSWQNPRFPLKTFLLISPKGSNLAKSSIAIDRASVGPPTAQSHLAC